MNPIWKTTYEGNTNCLQKCSERHLCQKTKQSDLAKNLWILIREYLPKNCTHMYIEYKLTENKLTETEFTNQLLVSVPGDGQKHLLHSRLLSKVKEELPKAFLKLSENNYNTLLEFSRATSTHKKKPWVRDVVRWVARPLEWFISH